MFSSIVLVAIALLTIGGLVAITFFVRSIFRPLQAARRLAEAEQAMRQFRMQREFLEAKFFDMARVSGKPRGLKWLDGDWQSEVTFARACDTGLLTAFAGLHVRFEAIEGGDMEGIAAVDTVRDAAAVFQYQRGRWGTGGRVLMNMNPTEALMRLAGQFVPVVGQCEGTAR